MPRLIPKDVLDDMANRYRAGETQQSIGERYGKSRKAIQAALKRHFGLARSDGGAAARHKRKRKSKADAALKRHIAKYGCSPAQYAELQEFGNAMVDSGISIHRRPIYAYHMHKSNAARRKVGWEMNIWQWWTIWRDSGKWDERGRSGYVMCRYGDVGPYSVDNVFIAHTSENIKERYIREKRCDFPLGVLRAPSGRFRATRSIGGKQVHLGTFDTVEEAHAAYLSAGAGRSDAGD